MNYADLDIIEVGGLWFHVRNNADKRVCAEIVKRGCYEKPALGFGVRSGETWLDIGANIGVFAVYAEKLKGAKVCAFEPVVGNAQLARDNFALNRCKSALDMRFVSAAGCSSKARVFVNETTPARCSAFSGKGIPLTVNTVSIDEIIRQYRPDGLKIDIEGSEFDILDRRFPIDGIRAIALEYHFRYNRSCITARRRLAWLVEAFEHNSIQSAMFNEPVWRGWQDMVCFFWND